MSSLPSHFRVCVYIYFMTVSALLLCFHPVIPILISYSSLFPCFTYHYTLLSILLLFNLPSAPALFIQLFTSALLYLPVTPCICIITDSLYFRFLFLFTFCYLPFSFFLPLSFLYSHSFTLLPSFIPFIVLPRFDSFSYFRSFFSLLRSIYFASSCLLVWFHSSHPLLSLRLSSFVSLSPLSSHTLRADPQCTKQTTVQLCPISPHLPLLRCCLLIIIV
jgi:hypothetical protein